MIGPYPILCRGHSGGRVVCEAFMRNGIRMGRVSEKQKDSMFFSIRQNKNIRQIILAAYDYLNGDAATRNRLQTLMRETVMEFLEKEIQHDGPFGWKIDPTLFTMPVVLDAFPTAKVVHLIRDGRDVMLSRLNARMERLNDPVNKLMVFGDSNVDAFDGQPLTPETIEKFRNELEMLHWVTSVQYGLLGRKYEDRYLEVKYEDICLAPIATFEKIFDFTGTPFLPETREWLTGAVSPGRIGKWESLPPETLARPLAIGGELLRALGYVND